MCFLVGSQKLYVFQKKNAKKNIYIGMESGLFSPGKHIGHQEKKRSHGGTREGSGRKEKKRSHGDIVHWTLKERCAAKERKRKQRHRETCETYVKVLNPFSKNRKKKQGLQCCCTHHVL